MEKEKFDEKSYKMFRQQLGKEIFKIPIPYKGKELALSLSGGIDSSVLCAIYSKQRSLRTYSIGFKDMNEFEIADKVAKRFNTIHKNIYVSRNEYLSVCKELIKLKREPLQNTNEPLLYLIAKRFKKDICNKKGVLLSGEGADELFGGYTQILNTVPNMQGKLIDNYLDRIIYDGDIWKNLKGKSKYIKIFKDNEVGNRNYDKVQNWLKRLHYPALLQRLRSINYVKDIEMDVPYANTMFVMLSEALPRTMRVNKTFLRICFGEILPNEVLEQEKIGFASPIKFNEWQEWNLEYWKKGESKINFWRKK